VSKSTKIFLASALIALLAVIGSGKFLMQSKFMTDGQKRDRILKMYTGYKKEFPGVQDVSPREAMHLFETGKVIFIDVREPDEQSVSRLPGAVSADLFLDNLEKYGDYIKIGYCTISYRSGVFAQELQHKGIPIYNLQGGLLAWTHAGGEVHNKGQETDRIHVYSQEWNLGPKRFEAVW